MNIYGFDVLKAIIVNGYTNQRSIATHTNYSLGTVNSALKALVNMQYLDEKLIPTNKCLQEISRKKPKNAIILAAGFGTRMVPINTEVPKGLLKIKGETLIERLINQLHEVGVYDIDVVVGFMKESYEYLIDQYSVNLVYNPNYAYKNNIHSLDLLSQRISNTYIIPCDIWAKSNPFSDLELYSWYAVSDLMDDESTIRVNRKMELVSVTEQLSGNKMIGIAYLLEEEASILRANIKALCSLKKYDKTSWEKTLFDKDDKMFVYGKTFKFDEICEINTYEQLRDIDENSEHLNSDIISMIAEKMNVNPNDIQEITVLKKGMTNRSFRFVCNNQAYIMRIPGVGSDRLVNRKNESDVYHALSGKNISDNVIYIAADSGYKITEYWNNARVCDPYNINDVSLCMETLRTLHQSNLQVSHSFELFDKIELYESFWNNTPSIFSDYLETKRKIFSLKDVIESIPRELKLTHIDAVFDNFLFVGNEVRLIDWEYASMQDPHLDIAMFAIYAMYNREHIDSLIDNYFKAPCPLNIRIKIYCYIAVCGLLWSNWCEYKRLCGIEFGEYSLRQYRYAKDYYNIVQHELSNIDINKGKEV